MSQRVRAGERDEVADAEPPLGEGVPEEREHELRAGQVRGVRLVGEAVVAAARLDLPQRAAELEGDGVAGGQRHDVRAGDGARAGRLQRRLGGVDDVQPAQRLVRRRRLLRAPAVQQHRRVAALREAVVEVEPQQLAGQARVRGRPRPGHVPNDGLRLGAGLLVEAHLETAGRRRRDGEQQRVDEEEQAQRRRLVAAGAGAGTSSHMHRLCDATTGLVADVLSCR